MLREIEDVSRVQIFEARTMQDVRENIRKWKAANPEKVKEYKKRWLNLRRPSQKELLLRSIAHLELRIAELESKETK